MKKILITGADSFVGTFVEAYLNKWPEKYHVDTLDMRDKSWLSFSFSGYDVVYHVAGIAHSDNGRISEEMKRLYYSVNTELAIETAKKAKAEGVRQFIFMSSSIVYGKAAPIGQSRIITESTPVSPANCYSDSKVQAERGILPLENRDFKVVVLRPPMIYGANGKGNFLMLEKLALRLPVFPKVKNERSMLYIGNLAEFVRLMIEHEESGIYCPCNREYSNTSEVVRMIAEANGKKVLLIPGFAWALKILSHLTSLVNKAFGNLTYDKHLSEYKEDYRLYTLAESIKETEGAAR